MPPRTQAGLGGGAQGKMGLGGSLPINFFAPTDLFASRIGYLTIRQRAWVVLGPVHTETCAFVLFTVLKGIENNQLITWNNTKTQENVSVCTGP